MSCFESSTFLKNPLVMDPEILATACKQLGWTYTIRQDRGRKTLLVTQIPGQATYGEYALMVQENRVTYNRYYLKNAQELVQELESVFYQLNVTYAFESIRREFKARGFKVLPNDQFKANEREKHNFKMVATSRLAQETEKRAEIEFTILHDGTVVSDSNYIPADVHDKADEAMKSLDQLFGSQRKEGEQIKRKPIPAKYQHKAYCKANKKIVAKY